ncbi:unnamed protein product [Bemisia tabaci]|uniref:Deoxynucleoside kinase domain-containing protein n=1 Tax=Bemisia tabaci TaxID=7038 RepID=A0A9P0AGM1_BEMTA|nr:unnamed protein product [Bemisia tabaci]
MSCNSARRPFTVFVEGNIGSGKSTFLSYFNDFADIFVALEPVHLWQDVNGHNILELMYETPLLWSFAFQSLVQKTMLDIHTAKCSQPVKMMERSLQSGRHVFIENLYRQNVMASAEYTVLTSFYESMLKNFDVNGDLIIYLRSDPEVVYNRMRERGRTEENQVSLEYLKQIHQLHEDWLVRKTVVENLPPVLILDANSSLATMEKEFKKCENIIYSRLNQLDSAQLSNASTPDILTMV